MTKIKKMGNVELVMFYSDIHHKLYNLPLTTDTRKYWDRIWGYQNRLFTEMCYRGMFEVNNPNR